MKKFVEIWKSFNLFEKLLVIGLVIAFRGWIVLFLISLPFCLLIWKIFDK